MSDLRFCPSCRRPALRVEDTTPLPPSWLADLDEYFATGDDQIEEDIANMGETYVKILIVPSWTSSLGNINPSRMSNVSFGCPWPRCKGKILLFKK